MIHYGLNLADKWSQTPNSQILNLPVLVLQQLQQHPHHLPLAVVIQLDGVLLQLGHQVICCHEPEVLVRRRHLLQEMSYLVRDARHDAACSTLEVTLASKQGGPASVLFSGGLSLKKCYQAM